MKEFNKLLDNQNRTTRWILIWLVIHLVTLVLMLIAGSATINIAQVSASAVAIALAYLLARRGREKLAAFGLCLILWLDFNLAAMVNLITGVNDDSLIIFSVSVPAMAGHLLGRYWIPAFAGASTLLFLVVQAIYTPGHYIPTVAYLASAAALYAIFEAIERRKPEQDQGIIHRYIERPSYIEIQLNTRRGDRLEIRVAKQHFRALSLQRGQRITIERGENRADENGKQYIWAFSIHIVDRDKN